MEKTLSFISKSYGATQMPNTKIFPHGYQQSHTSYGHITITGEDKDISDSAKITFEYHDGTEKTATLKVYQLSKLKSSSLFKQAKETGTESLLHSWTTKKSQQHIIKFSTDKELAVVFSSESDVEEDFLKLVEGHFDQIEYFTELKFQDHLKSISISMQQLRSITGMDDEKIQLLTNNLSGFKRLSENGISLSTIGTMNTARLQVLLKSIHHLLQLLPYGITLHQITLLDNDRVELLANKANDIKRLVENGVTWKQIEGMDNERILLLMSNTTGVERLLKHGATAKQIGSADKKALSKCLKSWYKLGDALLFVTMGQLLGIDHVPPAINASSESKEKKFLCLQGITAAGTHGDFSYNTFSANELKITHKNNQSETKLTITFGTPAAEAVDSLVILFDCLKANPSPDAPKPEKLVHDWYLISASTNETTHDKVTTRYCPDSKCLMNEACQAGFPEEELKKNSFGVLIHSPYYFEKEFVNSLVKLGSSLDELKNLKGMTQTKIETLCWNESNLRELLKLGMKFTDIAQVDENRLEHVMSQFYKAKSALEFVDVFELFGLSKKPTSTYEPRMLRSNAACSSTDEPGEESKDRSNCVIV